MKTMTKNVLITKEGLEQLKDELEFLAGEKRREVAGRIKEAREFGDISENSEYNEAKNEQAMLETRISMLEAKLRAARVVDSSQLSDDVVGIGSVVHVKDEKSGATTKYKIVGTAEANPLENKLSNESPVGKALLGRSLKDVISIPVPRGPERKLKITKIDV
jgi:transcription elongation factor GreA